MIFWRWELYTVCSPNAKSTTIVLLSLPMAFLKSRKGGGMDVELVLAKTGMDVLWRSCNDDGGDHNHGRGESRRISVTGI